MTENRGCIVKYASYCVKKKEKAKKSSRKVNPIIFIIPSSHKETK
jgi:hypothetical protein